MQLLVHPQSVVLVYMQVPSQSLHVVTSLQITGMDIDEPILLHLEFSQLEAFQLTLHSLLFHSFLGVTLTPQKFVFRL